MYGAAGAAQPASRGEPSTAGRASALGVAAGEGALDARLSLLMSSGGDERIWPDAVTGRTRYGTIFRPAPTEISFASSTANTISTAGYAEALRTLEALLDRGAKSRLQLQDWLCRLRAEIATLCGRGDSEVVLAASGTDAELIALAIAQRLTAGPITNIVVAPGETGSGVPRAAAGLHFQSTSCLGGPVSPGERLGGWSDADIEVSSVDIRTADGEPRDPAAVDLDVAAHAERALARGRGVLLHVLDTSKTGLSGLSRDMAARIVALAPERVHVLIDACQLRCPAGRLGSDLDRGFMVLVTGSKFAGGPPLSGALLLPRSMRGATRRCAATARGPRGLQRAPRLARKPASDLRERSDDDGQSRGGPALDGRAGGAQAVCCHLDRGLTDQFFDGVCSRSVSAGASGLLLQAVARCRARRPDQPQHHPARDPGPKW